MAISPGQRKSLVTVPPCFPLPRAPASYFFFFFPPPSLPDFILEKVEASRISEQQVEQLMLEK